MKSVLYKMLKMLECFFLKTQRKGDETRKVFITLYKHLRANCMQLATHIWCSSFFGRSTAINSWIIKKVLELNLQLYEKSHNTTKRLIHHILPPRGPLNNNAHSYVHYSQTKWMPLVYWDLSTVHDLGCLECCGINLGTSLVTIALRSLTLALTWP